MISSRIEEKQIKLDKDILYFKRVRGGLTGLNL